MKVSVTVPVRDEEAALGCLIDSLLAQTRVPDEIVLADGGSTDGTVVLARAYEGRGVRLLEIGPAFPGRGRNRAIEAARHEWVALIDAGCVADPRWLESLLKSLSESGERVRAVFGCYEPRIRTEWDVAQALALVPPADPASGCRTPSTASALLHRSAWQQVGGFPEDLRAAEDLVFFERLAAARVPSTWCPEAVVLWSLAPTPGAVFRRLRVYSAHHLAAGLSGTWHLRVMLMDVAALVLTLACFFWPPAALLLVAGVVARVARTIRRGRSNVPAASALRPDRLVRVAALLLLADLAAGAGLLDRLRGRVPGP